MAAIKAIAMVCGTLWLLFGLGLAWTAHKFERDIRNSDTSTSSSSSYDSDSDDSYRPRYNDEYERERRRQREGVNIDTDNARPMVDVDPNR